MPPIARVVLLWCLSLPLSAAEPDRRIAVTIDDLPWQRIEQTSDAALADRHAQLLAQLKRAGVPIVGFVNEGKLERDGRPLPERVSMLRDWRDAGFELGNHTFDHVDLHEVGLPAFEEQILRGETVLRPLLAEVDERPRWFRHPYLRAGRTPEDRAALSAFLAGHGYRIAPVTVDNGEWVWAFAYANVLEGSLPPNERGAMLQRLRDGYVPYMLDKLDYYERQSQALLGYALPQIWLMHANELNAAAFADLIDATKKKGYRFITLEAALRDRAYARGEEGYDGRFGPSWLHRWAMAEKKPEAFYAGEPEVPKWVLDLAGVENE